MLKHRTLLSIILLMSVLVIFSACSASGSKITKYSAKEMGDIIVSSDESLSSNIALTPDDNLFSQYIYSYFGDMEFDIEEAVIYYPSDSTQADEIAVFKFQSESHANAAEEQFKLYGEIRLSTFEGYEPEEAEMIRDSLIIRNGNYVALLMSENAETAKDLFMACFSENPPEVPVVEESSSSESSSESSTESTLSESSASESSATSAVNAPLSDEYDHDSVLKAYQSGDTSSLTPKNLAIYEETTSVISEYIKDDMSEYEKELVIHDYIITNTSYDETELSALPNTASSPEHDNPYGTLIEGKSICSGYTSTFQLFMDMLEIECISIEGTANRNKGEHAWNMVKLDGEWYFVDVTWDDPVGGSENNVEHTYFNVTSEKMRSTNHFWEETAYPEATATKYAYK